MGGMPGGPAVTETLTGFRGRLDLDAENDETNGWLAPLNEDWVTTEFDTNFRIRFLLVASSLVDVSGSGQFQLWYSYNSGGFLEVAGDSSVIKATETNVSGYDDDDDTTEMISSGTYKPPPNRQVQEGSSVVERTGSFNWGEGGGDPQNLEIEWVLQLVGADLSKGDTIELRLFKAGTDNFNGGYLHFPFIHINGPRVEIKGKEMMVSGKEIAIK